MNKTAKEMFEELGYEEHIAMLNQIKYKNEKIDISVIFSLNKNTYSILGMYGHSREVNMSLHKAIQKQIEELGW